MSHPMPLSPQPQEEGADPSQSLRAFLPRMDEVTHHQWMSLVRYARAIENPYTRARAFLVLAPLLPPDLKPIATQVARAAAKSIEEPAQREEIIKLVRLLERARPQAIEETPTAEEKLLDAIFGRKTQQTRRSRSRPRSKTRGNLHLKIKLPHPLPLEQFQLEILPQIEALKHVNDALAQLEGLGRHSQPTIERINYGSLLKIDFRLDFIPSTIDQLRRLWKDAQMIQLEQWDKSIDVERKRQETEQQQRKAKTEQQRAHAEIKAIESDARNRELEARALAFEKWTQGIERLAENVPSDQRAQFIEQMLSGGKTLIDSQSRISIDPPPKRLKP